VTALEAQDRGVEAKQVRQQLDQAWSRADIIPVRTAF
jgi:hypothetical protein